jgi:hypothetical protein
VSNIEKNSLQNLGFDTLNPEKYDDIPNFNELPDLHDWHSLSILTLDWAALLLAGISPYGVNINQLNNVYGIRESQIRKAEVMLKALMSDIVFGKLEFIDMIVVKEDSNNGMDYYKYDIEIKQKEVVPAHLHTMDTSRTTIQYTTFMSWIARKKIKSIRVLSLEKMKYEQWKKQQEQATIQTVDVEPVQPEVSRPLIGYEYTNKALEFTKDCIEQNYENGDASYLSDPKAQREYILKAAPAHGVNPTVAEAVFKVLRPDGVADKFTKNNHLLVKPRKK